jgi:hypothetical protein
MYSASPNDLGSFSIHSSFAEVLCALWNFLFSFILKYHYASFRTALAHEVH